MRDGTVHFILFFLLNAVHMVCIITDVFVYTTTLTAPLSGIIMSRFLLSLREIILEDTLGGYPLESPSFSHVSSLRFASAVGSNGDSANFASGVEQGSGGRQVASEDHLFGCSLPAALPNEGGGIPDGDSPV
ncbi:hypothetical protein CERSUDRAFT_114132 [Gelatoporia subvermispora B]|uniref:Uncharacterized protein n=1 Tax=Ceriporiopsis subvermispora (strain B) TaxID=914234 RepID=M2QZ96_CERS8|nr:hypothetical protein CERSUDRAFT_114132 [Gelatoporia subvermispora B]